MFLVSCLFSLRNHPQTMKLDTLNLFFYISGVILHEHSHLVCGRIKCYSFTRESALDSQIPSLIFTICNFLHKDVTESKLICIFLYFSRFWTLNELLLQILETLSECDKNDESDYANIIPWRCNRSHNKMTPFRRWNESTSVPSLCYKCLGKFYLKFHTVYCILFCDLIKISDTRPSFMSLILVHFTNSFGVFILGQWNDMSLEKLFEQII